MKTVIGKILSLAVCLGAITSSFALPVSAAEPMPINENVKVINLSNNISDQAIQEIVNDVSASVVKDDGTVVPVESVITIENVSDGRARSGLGNTYQVRSVTKVKSDSDSKNAEGVSASVNLSITWTDNLGYFTNTLDSISGSVNVYRGAISSSALTYGCMGYGVLQNKIQLGTQSSFYINANMAAPTPGAEYQVFFQGAIFELNVGVHGSAFDR